MRLIDADALLEKVQLRLPGKSRYAEVIARCVEITRQLIVDAPTIDAVPVVRCKDCNSFGTYCSGRGYCTHQNGIIEPKPDDFCSYGEKDGEG